jgi:phage shock protein B
MNSYDTAQVAMASIAHKSEMDDITGIVIVLSVLLLCVALPIWLHYRTKGRVAVAAASQAGVQDLWKTAQRMEARIGYLETVLDTEVPGWRGRSERS